MASEAAYNAYLAQLQERRQGPAIPSVAETMRANGWPYPVAPAAIGSLSVGREVLIAHVDAQGATLHTPVTGEVVKVLPDTGETGADYAHVETAQSTHIISSRGYVNDAGEPVEFQVFPLPPTD